MKSEKGSSSACALMVPRRCGGGAGSKAGAVAEPGGRIEGLRHQESQSDWKRYKWAKGHYFATKTRSICINQRPHGKTPFSQDVSSPSRDCGRPWVENEF